jgi:serine/threonine protein kinase
MSPEQVKDDPLDGRSDLFSLGAVLYQCVSGVTPFSGDSLVQVVYKILNIDPRPLKLAATPALTQLAGVVERSLQKDPNSRFQTGSDFAEALEQIRLAMEADPGQDFRGTPPPPGFRPTPSDTIPTFVAPSQADPPSGSSTRTVQLSTASIHRATQGDPSPSGTHETVATGVRPGDRDSKMSRWRIAALLLLLLSVAGVSAVFRFERDNTSPTEVSTVTPSTEAATRERLIDSTEPPEPKLEAPVERAPEQTTAKAPSPQPQITTPRNENPTRQAAKQNPVVIEQVEDPSLQAEPVPQTLTPVTILYKHKGGPAFLSILLDGTRVWSQELKPVQGRMQKWTGYGNRAVIAVPPGTHTLQVNLSDPERDIDATNAIRSRYTNGKKRTLRVSLSPKENTLQLRWKE